MKKLLFFTLLLSTHTFIQANDTQTTGCQNTNEVLELDENGQPVTKNPITENVVLKILQEENERLAKEIHNQEQSNFFIQSCIFGVGLITGLLLGIIIHLQWRTDQAVKLSQEFRDYVILLTKYTEVIKEQQHYTNSKKGIE